MGRETFRCEWVKCGKECGGCPHGPYWYAYWREGKRVRKRYVGKGDPRGRDADDHQAERPHRHDDIFNDRLAGWALAWEILGCRPGGLAEATARYRVLCKELHPDRNPGAAPVLFKRVQAAYAYLRRRLS